MKKTAKIKAHLEREGRITSLEAFQMYNATRLSSIIYNLRHDGMKIATEMQYTRNAEGEPVQYGVYILHA